jgi:hypothetical protein
VRGDVVQPLEEACTEGRLERSDGRFALGSIADGDPGEIRRIGCSGARGDSGDRTEDEKGGGRDAQRRHETSTATVEAAGRDAAARATCTNEPLSGAVARLR